jgi:prepilin-type N-terminal cleavage/methylation domain-containing protein
MIAIRCRTRASCRRGLAGAGFTLLEVLLVISIMVLLLAIAIPSFSSLLYTSDQSLAENALRGGLQSARDAAIRSASGQDTAAVFYYDRGKASIVVCQRAGTLDDGTLAQSKPREVFAPISGFDPAQLPTGWTVRGLVPSGSINAEWYEKTYLTLGPGFTNQASWVLPETSLFDVDASDDGRDRQTFMVRFQGGTGELVLGDGEPVLVLAVVPSDVFRQGGLFSNWNALREGDGVRFARRVLGAPMSASNAPNAKLSFADRKSLLGDVASDTVLTRPVAQLVVCQEKKALAAVGLTPDRVTGTFYQDAASSNEEPKFIADPAFAQKLRDLNKWLVSTLENPPGQPVDSDARLFTVQRYLGVPQEVGL